MKMEDNPILKALPPETDYISYLTILEYNLNVQQLPTLHNILQDTTLTANIGWDLVHLLLPLLPASAQCLQDVARLGNPREVVLKVTELLETITNEQEESEDTEEEADDADKAGELDEDGEEGVKLKQLNVNDQGSSTTPSQPDLSNGHATIEHIAPEPTKAEEAARPLSKEPRFTALLEMLAILHPRIKTKYPSRFLSTALQAVLPAYSKIARLPEATEAVLGLIKTLSGTERPRLPPRKSSSVVSTINTLQSAPDPEGQDEALGVDESSLQRRLLQSFLTFVAEAYISSTAKEEYVSGLAWCTRYQEKLHPEKVIPGTTTATSLFGEDESLHARDAITGHILALVRDLKIHPEELVHAATKNEEEDVAGDPELPSTASDVPFSRTGSLYLLATMAASSVLFGVPTSMPLLHLLPDFAAIVMSFIGDPSIGGIGMEPVPLIDSILFLGFVITNTQEDVVSENDQNFNNILQRLSLVSANMPQPPMRYNAHLLTSTILHLHPSDHVRLAFIRDTLEHCPYENLKASAVGWLKDELLLADKQEQQSKVSDDESSIFSSPVVLTILGPFLFINPSTLLEGQSPAEDHEIFLAYQPFFLAVLNLLYLLLTSSSLYTNLDIASLLKERDPSQFLKPLEETANGFREKLMSGDLGYRHSEGEDIATAGSRYREEKDRELAPMKLLAMTVQEVLGAMAKHGILDSGQEA